MQLLWRNAGKGGTRASIQSLSGGTLRVTLQMVRPFRAEAGKHVWIYIPSVGYWMSHPFAVAWDNTPFGADVDQPRMRNQKRTEFHESGERLGPQTVTLLVRRRGGFTAALGRKVMAARGRLLVKTWVEGPYASKSTECP